MGASKDEVTNRRQPTMGAVAPSRYSGQSEPVGTSGLWWGQADPGIYMRAVDAVNARGDGISFARGARGAWVSLTILSGGERYKKQATSIEQMDAILDETWNEATRN